MKSKLVIVLAAVLLAIWVWAQRKPAPPHATQFAGILDLSHEISEKTPPYDLKDKFEAHTVATFDKE